MPEWATDKTAGLLSLFDNGRIGFPKSLDHLVGEFDEKVEPPEV
jgi:hypothetical protein